MAAATSELDSTELTQIPNQSIANHQTFSSTSASNVASTSVSAPATVQANRSEPVPSFQDLTDSSDSDDEHDDDQDWDDLVRKVKAAYSHDQIQEMMHYLKERGLFAFMKRFVDIEHQPIPRLLLAFGILLPPEMEEEQSTQLRMLKVACSRVLRNREKLEEHNTVDDAVSLISSSKKILVLTGAGVSTSCGIPDFRSPTGLYARLKEENWDLDDPQQMFDLPYFKEKPNVFYSFAKEIYPSNFTPSPCHRFVKVLETNNKLLRNYTQNIDGLFEKVGVEKILNCHGSFATASCLRCRRRFPGSAIEADVFAQNVPLCPFCTTEDAAILQAKAAANELLKKKKKPTGDGWNEDSTSDEEEDKGEWEGKPLIKPDIVFFGEMLSDEFDRRLLEDREEVDLLIVIGTSLRVSPVAQIVSHLPHSIPQILINRDPVGHANFDIHLLGDGDTIVRYLADRLGSSFALSAVPPRDPTQLPVVPERVGDSHVWLFPGANRDHPWVGAVRKAFGVEEEDDENEEDEEESSDDGVAPNGLQVPQMGDGITSRSRSRSPESGEETESKKIRVE